MEIWVDKETGVQYVYHLSGYAGGMSPLWMQMGNRYLLIYLSLMALSKVGN